MQVDFEVNTELLTALEIPPSMLNNYPAFMELMTARLKAAFATQSLVVRNGQVNDAVHSPIQPVQ